MTVSIFRKLLLRLRPGFGIDYPRLPRGAAVIYSQSNQAISVVVPISTRQSFANRKLDIRVPDWL